MSGTTLDASTVIAALDPEHVNHAAAAAQLRAAETPLWLHPITLAEILVPYTEPREMVHRLSAIGVRVFDADQDLPAMTKEHAIDLARVRRQSGAKMPDVCVITTAWLTRTPIASLDKGLLAAAERFRENATAMHPETPELLAKLMQQWKPLLDALAKGPGEGA